MKLDRRLVVLAAAVLAPVALAGALAATMEEAGGGPAATPAKPQRIRQPALGAMAKLPLAPDSQRVDLTVPGFSRPTEVTNPLFPISELRSAVLLGEVGGEPLKIETTLLPVTRTVDWNGRRIEALQSQFLAYVEGRIHEVAIDLYAQDDDGAVWYLGEDVFNYEDGVVADTEGTWRAGVDGPAAMIMPADPKVGNVYRAENVPGLVFEQVTVEETGKTVEGPRGRVEGAIVARELHMEGDLEAKTFAPGYGEFFSGSGHDFEALALAVPTDALSGSPPAELERLARGADDVFEAARARSWSAASAALERMTADWEVVRAPGLPPRPARRLNGALDALAEAIADRKPRPAGEAALELADASLDLQLQYRPPAEIDRARFDLQARRLLLDAAAGAAAAVAGDVTTLEWIRDRIPLRAADARRVDDELRYLEAAAEAGELEAVTDATERLRETVSGL